jgi:hypothetical protein
MLATRSAYIHPLAEPDLHMCQLDFALRSTNFVRPVRATRADAVNAGFRPQAANFAAGQWFKRRNAQAFRR